MKTIAVVVGSLREGSYCLKTTKAIEKLAEGKLKFDYLELADIPMFNQDLEADLPASVARVKDQITAADGVLIVTPEYNRAYPPLVKNIVDWASRPYAAGVWTGKPAAAIGVTPGGTNAVAATVQLTELMTTVGMYVMGAPGVYLSVNDDFFAADGGFADEGTKGFIGGWVDAFDDFAGKFA
ncbi:MAG: NADPH-dependent FMN reductase [Mangrovicoccus sp.]